MRRSIRSSTSSVKVRTVPCSSTLSGTTFVASPAWTMVTETTPASMGLTLRLTMVCRPRMSWAATGSGSITMCGMAAWPPLPRTTMRNSLLDAMAGSQPWKSQICFVVRSSKA